jgi:hypothetical protein
MSIEGIAANFIEVATYLRTAKADDPEPPASHARRLFATVTAAGFKPKMLELGILKGHYADGDGRRTNDTFNINSLCPYKVVREDGTDDVFATGWLDCLVRFTSHPVQKETSARTLVADVACRIDDSNPLTPIQLSAVGDFLIEEPVRPRELDPYPYFVKHVRDEDTFRAGIHQYCGGFVTTRRTTSTHEVVICNGCHLRIPIPLGAVTYGDVRKTLAETFGSLEE